MTFAAMQGGLNYPELFFKLYTTNQAPGLSNETAMALTGDRTAYIGYAKVNGRATSKVCSAAGGAQIVWKSAAVTWANAGTTMDVGIQGVASGAGPVAQPDGTYGVKRTLTGGDGNVTANAIKTTTMTGGSGTSTISHGDLIAVVWDMTARAGTDSVICNAGGTAGCALPTTNYRTAAAWRTTTGRLPNVVIISDDGTLITLEETLSITSTVVETWAEATNPDERGLIFQVPWDCKIDGFFGTIGTTDAASDYTIALYADPLGTPTVVTGATLNILAERGSQAGTDKNQFFPFAAEVSLVANTDYVVAIHATGTTNMRLPTFSLMDQTHRALNPGGTSVKKVTRDGGTGAFTAEATPTTMYNLGVRVSSVNVTSGGTKVYTA